MMIFIKEHLTLSFITLLMSISFFPTLFCDAITSTSTSITLYPHGRDREHDYEIIKEEVHYSGWRKVIRRSVHSSANPNRMPIDFDVIDQTTKGGAVIIFAWNSTNKTATIVREYMPGKSALVLFHLMNPFVQCEVLKIRVLHLAWPHRVLSGLAAGIVEDDKHSSKEGEDSCLIAARMELEEECHLAGGTWYRLTEEHVAVPMDKYVVTEITPYLVIDAEHVHDPRPLDDEEDIEIIRGVTSDEIIQMIREGDFNLVGGWGALLALQKLRELGEIQ